MPSMKARLRLGLAALCHDPENGAHPMSNPYFQEVCLSRTDKNAALFPFDGLWGKELPLGLSRENADAIRSYLIAFQAQATQGHGVWGKFQRENKKDEYTMGRKALTHVVEGFLERGLVRTKIGNLLRERHLHPGALFKHTGDGSLASNKGEIMAVVGPYLWGPEGMNPHYRNKVKPEYVGVTEGLVAEVWDKMTRESTKWENDWQGKVIAVDAAFSALQGTQPCLKDVRKVMKACKALNKQAGKMCDDEVLAVTEDKLMELEKLMMALKERQKTGKCKNIHHIFQATEDEIQAVLAHYFDVFHSDPVDPQVVQGLPQLTGDDKYLREFNALNEEQLCELLGIPCSGSVPFFNKHLSLDGRTPMGDPEFFAGMGGVPDDQLPEGVVPCRLRWAQLVGIAGMIKMFTEDDDAAARKSMLLADEVGLGKTGIVMGMIAIFIHARKRLEKGLQLPPIFKHARWGTSDTLPNAPWLIVCPASLVTNWVMEMQRFFQNGSVKAFTCTGTYKKRGDFWGDEGGWTKATEGIKDYQKIVICASTSLADEARGALDLNAPLNNLAEARDHRPTALQSIFDTQWAGVAFDEAHELRTRNVKFEAMTNIREKTHSLVLATATPLFTGTTDLLNLQRVAGLGSFGEEADRLEKEQRSQVNALKREGAKRLQNEGVMFEDDQDGLQRLNQEHVQEIKLEFCGRIIRRTPEDKRWDGTPLLELPEVQDHIALVTPMPEEKEELDRICKKATSKKNGQGFSSRAFYNPYRVTLSNYRLARGEKLPPIRTPEDWQKVKSSKWDGLVRLLQYLLKDDRCPKDFQNPDNGEFQIPEYEPPPDAPQTDKIIIFQEFMSHASYLQKVLKAHGIDSLLLNGSRSTKQRDMVKKAFNAKGGPRVLIMSKVGTTGVNLARANHIVMLDLQWAAQDNHQALGRLWRFPQTKIVYRYTLIARETTDVMMARIAAGKAVLLGEFFDKEPPSHLVQFLDEFHPLTEAQALEAVDKLVKQQEEQDRRDSGLNGREKRKRQPGKSEAEGSVDEHTEVYRTTEPQSKKQRTAGPKVTPEPSTSALQDTTEKPTRRGGDARDGVRGEGTSQGYMSLPSQSQVQDLVRLDRDQSLRHANEGVSSQAPLAMDYQEDANQASDVFSLDFEMLDDERESVGVTDVPSARTGSGIQGIQTSEEGLENGICGSSLSVPSVGQNSSEVGCSGNQRASGGVDDEQLATETALLARSRDTSRRFADLGRKKAPHISVKSDKLKVDVRGKSQDGTAPEPIYDSEQMPILALFQRKGKEAKAAKAAGSTVGKRGGF